MGWPSGDWRQGHRVSRKPCPLFTCFRISVVNAVARQLWLICTQTILNRRKFCQIQTGVVYLRFIFWEKLQKSEHTAWDEAMNEACCWHTEAVQAQALLTLGCERVLIPACIIQENILRCNNGEWNLLLCSPLIIVTLGIPSELYLLKFWLLDTAWGQNSAPLQPTKKSSCMKARKTPLYLSVGACLLHSALHSAVTHPCTRAWGLADAWGFRCSIINILVLIFISIQPAIPKHN